MGVKYIYVGNQVCRTKYYRGGAPTSESSRYDCKHGGNIMGGQVGEAGHK